MKETAYMVHNRLQPFGITSTLLSGRSLNMIFSKTLLK
jgi:hypothetical protein